MRVYQPFFIWYNAKIFSFKSLLTKLFKNNEYDLTEEICGCSLLYIALYWRMFLYPVMTWHSMIICTCIVIHDMLFVTIIAYFVIKISITISFAEWTQFEKPSILGWAAIAQTGIAGSEFWEDFGKTRICDPRFYLEPMATGSGTRAAQSKGGCRSVEFVIKNIFDSIKFNIFLDLFRMDSKWVGCFFPFIQVFHVATGCALWEVLLVC